MLFLKTYVYLKSDGLLSTAKLIFNSVCKLIYDYSETIFLESYSPVISELKIPEGYGIQILTRTEELENIDFPRLKLLPYKDWFLHGSTVCVVLSHARPIAFAWTHVGSYYIHGTGTVKLGKNEQWIGPTFVNVKHRGKGINKLQLQYLINQNKKFHFLTSVNSKNIPSLNSFLHLGFSKLCIYSAYHGFFCRKAHSTDWKYIQDTCRRIVLK